MMGCSRGKQEKPKKKAGYVKKKKVIVIQPDSEGRRTLGLGSKERLQLVLKKCDELSKHQANIRTILACSNATPIRKYGGVGYMCAFCTREFAEPKLLKNHTRRTHDEPETSNYVVSQTMSSFVVKLDITNLQCTICQNPFTKLEDFTDHLKSHNKTYHELKSHIIPFRFEAEKFVCVMCGVQFSNFKVLFEHMNVHFRNHVCEVCGKGYVNKTQFQTHTYRHNTGVFKCSYCSKVFDTRVKCKAHERTHVLVKGRSKCAYCGERFKDYARKREHEVRSHGAAPVVLACDTCGKAFGNQRAMNLHNKTYHLMERKLAK